VDKHLLKRRIIGAAVLVGLGVIFIPMILSGGRDEMPLFGSNIPNKPESIAKLRSIEIPRPVPPPEQETIRLPVNEHIPATKIEKKAAGKPVNEESLIDKVTSLATINTKQNGKAWAVQVGSFSQRNNALALQKKLRKKKFPAFVEFVKNKKGGVYRVRVGPEVKRDKANKTLKSIEQKLGMKGVVVNHP